jgi:predicted Zn-dependent protease
MSRPSSSRRSAARWILVLALGVLSPVVGFGQAPDVPANAEVVARYEQILERAPQAGPSLDRLLQIYQQGDGLDQLDQRWGKLADEPGAKGATYSLLRGLLADNAGRTDDALKYLKVATDRQPDDFHGWLALGDAAGHLGRWADSAAAYQKGLATKVAGDDRLTLYRKLGKAQQGDLDVTGAMATWRKMVEEFPTDRFAVEEAGTAELDAEQYDEARKTFQHLVDLAEPDNMNRVQALMHLADVDNRQGKTEAAVHGYETILPLTADGSWLNRQLRAQIEQIFRRDNDLTGLAAYYQRWSQAHPKDVDALLLLAGVLGELDRKTEALDALRKTTVLAPDRHEVRQTFAQLLVEQGQYDEAVAVETALTADDPTEPRYWETLGEAHWKKTQPPTPASQQAALDAWTHIAPADSKDVGAVVGLADLLHAHHLDAEALAGYQHGLALTPEAVDLREKEAKVLVDLKRPDEAWSVLDALVADNRGTAANYAQLAQLQQAFGRADAAAATLQKGLALDPTSFELLAAEWNRRVNAPDWPGVVAMFDRLMAAAPDAGVADQIESRHLQALASAGQLDETAARLQARLGAEPGLSEAELRLLVRILIQRSDTAAVKALDEARRRFPQSVSLNRLAADFASQQGGYDAAVASLQRLLELDPQQQVNWLTQIVRVRQQQGNTEEALKTADQLIAASPASAAGYLLYADIALAAGRTDAAVTRLKAAVLLCEKPNDIRQRLIRFYLEAGEPGQARAVADEAFEAAEDQTERLAMVRLMATAYAQDGRLDELISRFKQEQGGDEESARFGAYLAAIYDQNQDPQSARRELAKSLAARPRDTALLRSLIALAEKGGDRAELLRYRETLVQLEPVEDNQIVLAAEYARQDKPAEAWRVMAANEAAVMKHPFAWKDLMVQIGPGEEAAKARGLLEAAFQAQGSSSLAGRLALGQLQILAGRLPDAEKIFWDLLAAPLPPAPVAPPAGGNPAPGSGPAAATGRVTAPANPLITRINQAYQLANEARQFLQVGQPGYNFQAVNGIRSGTFSAATDPAMIKDRALVYLAALAVQQNQAAGFLQTLSARLAEWRWPVAQRLVVYDILQTPEPLLQTLEEQAQSSGPNRDLDELGYSFSDQYANQQNLDPALAARFKAAKAGLRARLETEEEPRVLNQYRMSEAFGNSDYSPEALEKRKAALALFLPRVNRRKPEELASLISYCAVVDDWTGVKAAVDDLQAIPGLAGNTGFHRSLLFLPTLLLSRPPAAGRNLPDDLPTTLVQLMRLGYPPTPPAAVAIAGTGQTFYYNQNTFPVPSRMFPQDRAQMLQQLYQQLKQHHLVPAMDAALAAEEPALGDWRQLSPAVARIYFQWLDGRRDEAVAAARAQLEQQPGDDLRQLLATMLIQQKKYEEAVTVLGTVTASHGQDYLIAQMQLLHAANLAGNKDEGKQAGLRLLAMRLPAQTSNQILGDLRNVGLTAEANKLMAANNAANQIFNQSPDQQLMQTLDQAATARDKPKSLGLARQILNRDPQAVATANPYQAKNLRDTALGALTLFDTLADYAREMEQQARANPDSLRSNLLAAEAYNALSDSEDKSLALRPGPHWLKMQRSGQQWRAFSSANGTDWTPLGDKITLKLAPRLLAGPWVGSVNQGPAASAAFDRFSFTLPANAPNPAVQPPAATAWQQADLGGADTAGKAAPVTDDGRLLVTGPIIGNAGNNPGNPGHFSYQTIEGDGDLVVRVDDVPGQPENAETGLMLRESLADASVGVVVKLNRQQGLVWQVRRADAGWSWIKSTGEFNLPLWLKLVRAGDKITGAFSNDGLAWSEVFSHEAPWAPAAYAGLIATGGGPDKPAGFKWDKIAVQPPGQVPAATGATGSAGGLPAPWQYMEIGRPTPLGRATWTDDQMTLEGHSDTTPSHGWGYYRFGTQINLYSGGYTLGGGFFHQPLSGDGEIAARELSASPGGSGPAFRAGLELTSPEIRFSLGPDGVLGFLVRTGAHDKATEYYRRATAISPDNPVALRALGQLHIEANRMDEALATVGQMLKTAPPDALQLGNDLLQGDQGKSHAADLARMVLDWKPPTLSPNAIAPGGANPDPYYGLQNLGNTLERLNHPDEAAQVYRKALALPTAGRYQTGDAVMPLVRVLLAQNRRDEAVKAIIDWFAGEPTVAGPDIPLLGQGNNPTNQLGRRNLFNSWGYNNQEFLPSQGVMLLERAGDLGLTGRLREILQTQAPTAPTPVSGPLDSDHQTGLILAVIARDPAYRPEVEKLLKAQPGAKLDSQGLTMAFWLVLVRELAPREEERPMALQILSRFFADYGDGSNQSTRTTTGLQLMRLAAEMGDHATVRSTLLGLAADRFPNLAQSALPPMLHAMIREAMFKEAADLLKDARTNAQNTNNDYFAGQINGLQGELDFAQGKTPPTTLAYGIDPGDGSPPDAGGKTEFFWELQGARPANVNVPDANPAVIWSDYLPVTTTNDRLEVETGPDESRLAPLAAFDHVAGSGHAPVQLPPGTRALRARLVPPSTPDGPPTPPVIGPIVWLGEGANLLPNPGFQATPVPPDIRTIVGWQGLLPTTVVGKTGGPLPVSGFATLHAFNGNYDPNPITSGRVPLPAAGPGLVFSGWVWHSGNIWLRFLDADGKAIRDDFLVMNGNNDEDWHWFERKLARDQPGGSTDTMVAIPAPAGFVQIVIAPYANMKLAGLSLRPLAGPVPATAPPAPVPTAPKATAAPATPALPATSAPVADPPARTPRSSR